MKHHRSPSSSPRPSKRMRSRFIDDEAQESQASSSDLMEGSMEEELMQWTSTPPPSPRPLEPLIPPMTSVEDNNERSILPSPNASPVSSPPGNALEQAVEEEVSVLNILSSEVWQRYRDRLLSGTNYPGVYPIPGFHITYDIYDDEWRLNLRHFLFMERERLCRR